MAAIIVSRGHMVPNKAAQGCSFRRIIARQVFLRKLAGIMTDTLMCPLYYNLQEESKQTTWMLMGNIRSDENYKIPPEF